MIDQIKDDLRSAGVPVVLVDALLRYYISIRENYMLGKYEPSSLNGGKFVEVCIRILQHEINGDYTLLKDRIKNSCDILRSFERAPASSNHDSFRIHIPRVLMAIYNVRNNRGVGHIGGDVDSNFVDSTLIVSCADWVLAEFIRVFYQCPLEIAQHRVNAIVQRPLFLVFKPNNKPVILLEKISYKDKVLLILYSYDIDIISDSELFSLSEHSNKSIFIRAILKPLSKSKMIIYNSKKEIMITPKGISYIESLLPELNERLKKEARNE